MAPQPTDSGCWMPSKHGTKAKRGLNRMSESCFYCEGTGQLEDEPDLRPTVHRPEECFVCEGTGKLEKLPDDWTYTGDWLDE